MKSPRTTLKVSTLVLGLAMLFGTSSAQAQTFNFYSWFRVTHHNFAFTSVSNVQDITYPQYILFGGYVQWKVGFSFVGTNPSGQSYTVQVMGPGGNIIGSRIDGTQMNVMEAAVRSFVNNSGTVLRLYNVEKYIYTPFTVTTSSRFEIHVANPVVSPYGSKSGGLVKLEIKPTAGDFYAETLIRRGDRLCGSGFQMTKFGVLRNSRSFIINRQSRPTLLSPASLDVARWFVETAVKSVGNLVLDVSGVDKLEDDAPNMDPYHAAAGPCVSSTYIIDDYIDDATDHRRFPSDYYNVFVRNLQVP